MSNKILSIIIPIFNKYIFTKSCLNDLSKLPNDHEIIVVDNGSSDETKVQLEGSTEIVYHRNEVNLGFSKGCNLGYSLSSSDNVLFLNNDVRVKVIPGVYGDHTNWTQRLLPFCQHSIVGPTMGQLDDNLNFIKEANIELSGNSYMSGWCIASSKNIWNKLEIERDHNLQYNFNVLHYVPQIFSEEYGLAYFEDTDLSFRARELNIPMQVVNIPVVHFGKQTSRQLNTPLLYNKARQIFVKKWGKQK